MPTIDIFARRRNRLLNTVHTWLLAAGSLLLLGLTAWAFGEPGGIAYAVIFGGISLWLVLRVSPQMVLKMYKARPVSAAEFPAGVAIVEELARRAELPTTPELYVIPSKMMNAFAVGRRDNAVIAVTDALVRNMTQRELAGVLAHEISHVAHEDVRVMAFADMVSRFTSLMSTVGLLSLFLNLLGFAGGYATQVPWLGVLVLLSAPTVGGLIQMALSRTREFDADLGAAILTGDPDGLASALAKLERAQGKLWEGLLLPGGRMPDPSVLRSHPLTAERIARLYALKGTVVDEAPPAARQTPQPRPSMVPQIRLRRGTSWAGLPIMHPLAPFEDEIPAGEGATACPGGLAAPDGDPRIRVMRGGVWW
ncbi:zinc metalloprotease HtpX [Arvimicrobium flavum]|uniref:zinc metalloprotease HtpX n=1 Tax=Arvimicrobium flavum TaxID=3393320 RepID=UPI00237ABBCB|nr:zinc metalloprotease HtpX [Mesorhizobium shangrilense]